MIYGFVTAITIFYVIMLSRYNTSVKPVLNSLGSNRIVMPSRMVDYWLLGSMSLLSMNAVLKARRNDFEMDQSLSFLALVLGVILGMIIDLGH